jgi:hypothetical protein
MGQDEKNRDGACVYFAYYFNPTPNDRNIEFDTEKNLFKGKGLNRIMTP